MPKKTVTLSPHRKLTPRQQELLARFVVQNNTARFTGGEVISDWKTIKQVFLTLGAEWKKGRSALEGGFAFPDDLDGHELVRLAQASGEILDPKEVGFYPTPADLASHVVRVAQIQGTEAVLEPSAGTGSLVAAVLAQAPRARVMAYEFMPDLASKLRQRCPDAVISEEDFLTIDPEPVFDAVVMNPPFDKRLDAVHIHHACGFLRPGGRLAAIASAGVSYRQDRETKAFRSMIEAGGRITDLPEGSFKESGTGVNTCLVQWVAP